MSGVLGLETNIGFPSHLVSVLRVSISQERQIYTSSCIPLLFSNLPQALLQQQATVPPSASSALSTPAHAFTTSTTLKPVPTTKAAALQVTS